MFNKPNLPFPQTEPPKPAENHQMTEPDFKIAAEHGGGQYAQQLRLAQQTGVPAISPNS